MARHISALQAHTFSVLALWAACQLSACGTGGTLVEGRNPFAAGGTGTQASAGGNLPGTTADPNDGNSTDPGTGNTLPTGTASVGVEIDTQGASVNTAFWTGALSAVGSLAPGAPLSVRLVVGRYSGGQLRLAYADDGSSALDGSKTEFDGDNGTEDLLTALDGINGVSVVLELQPGTETLTTLATEVLKHFSGHPCVTGVGINLTQYGTSSLNIGSKSLSSTDATALVAAVQSVSATAQVHLRSYSRAFMPSSARAGLVFVLDASGFSGLADMKNDYSTWAGRFSQASVQFVTAASRDSSWACKLPGGPGDLLSASLAISGNVSGVQWSQDTIAKLYPTNTFSCLTGS